MKTETTVTSLEILGKAWKSFSSHCPDHSGHLTSFANLILTIGERGWGETRQRRAYATTAVWHLSGAMNKLMEVETSPPLGIKKDHQGRVFHLDQKSAEALKAVAEAQVAAETGFPFKTGDTFNNAARGLTGCAHQEVTVDAFHRAMMVYLLAWGQLAIL